MANGDDKNWVRLCLTVGAFRQRFGRWPTLVRIGQLELDNLRDLYSPKRWGRVASKLEFIAGPHVPLEAQGERGSVAYDSTARVDQDAVVAWLGAPDFPQHLPRFVERAAFAVPSNPFDYEGGPDRWRPYFRDAAARRLEEAGLRHLATEVKITARFFVKKSKRGRDLDNMTKNLIDALGAAGLLAPARGGGKKTEWNTEDHWVCGIDVERYFDAENPRVEVEIWVRVDDAEGAAPT